MTQSTAIFLLQITMAAPLVSRVITMTPRLLVVEGLAILVEVVGMIPLVRDLITVIVADTAAVKIKSEAVAEFAISRKLGSRQLVWDTLLRSSPIRKTRRTEAIAAVNEKADVSIHPILEAKKKKKKVKQCLTFLDRDDERDTDSYEEPYDPAPYTPPPAAAGPPPADNYYPYTNSFPPPPGPSPNPQPASYNPTEYPPASGPPPVHGYPPPPGAPPGNEPYAPQPRRADENVSVPFLDDPHAADGGFDKS